MSLKSLFNTLVKGKEKMLAINTPVTLTLDSTAAFLSLGGLAVINLPVIGTGLSLLTISATISYLLGSRDQGPGAPSSHP